MNVLSILAKQMLYRISAFGSFSIYPTVRALLFVKVSVFRPNFPFSPAKVPVFYGWIVLVGSVLGAIASIPGQTIGVSVFTEHLMAAMGLSRLQLANAYLAGTLISGCLLPVAGKLLDRLGARRVAMLAASGLGVTLMYLTACDRFSTALSAWLTLDDTVIATLLLVLGFVCLRFFGQGLLTMTSRTMLGKWFDRRRGQVSGIQGIFVAFGFAIAPNVFSGAIASFGWRGVWRLLAIVVGIGVSGAAWLLFRDNPEMCGLRMDGEKSLTFDEKETSVEKIWGFTRREALRTLAFWAVSLAFASQALSITGITFNIVSIGAEMGFAEREIVDIFVPNAMVSTAVGFVVGLLCDRMRLQLIFMFMMVAQAMGIAAVANLDVPVMWTLAVVGLGISGGCFGTLTAVVLPRFFGRAHLGAIAGVQMMIIVMASAIGPSLLASSKAVTGSYVAALYGCCLFAPVVVGLMVFVRSPAETR